MNIAARLSSSIVFFPHSDHPTVPCHTTSNLSTRPSSIADVLVLDCHACLLLLLNVYTHQVGDEHIDQFISDQWLGS